MNLTLKNTHNGMLQDIYKHLHNTHKLFHTITQYENTNPKGDFMLKNWFILKISDIQK